MMFSEHFWPISTIQKCVTYGPTDRRYQKSIYVWQPTRAPDQPSRPPQNPFQIPWLCIVLALSAFFSFFHSIGNQHNCIWVSIIVIAIILTVTLLPFGAAALMEDEVLQNGQRFSMYVCLLYNCNPLDNHPFGHSQTRPLIHSLGYSLDYFVIYSFTY